MDVDWNTLISGDKAAWDVFVEAQTPLIYAVVRRALERRGRPSGAEEAADLTQDVFLRLVRDDFRALRRFDPKRGALATWLTVVARNVVADAFRKKRVEETGADPKLEAVAADPSEIECAIPRGVLTARQRLILTLLYERGLSVEQVAEILSIERQSVRSARHKALERLRRYYDANPERKREALSELRMPRCAPLRL